MNSSTLRNPDLVRPADESLCVCISALTEDLSSGRIRRLYWVNTLGMLADALTKGSIWLRPHSSRAAAEGQGIFRRAAAGPFVSPASQPASQPSQPSQPSPFCGRPPNPPTPSSVWGRVRKSGASRRSRRRVWGGLGWHADRVPAAPGCPPGDVQSAAARTLPGAFRGAGRARARPGCVSERPGEFWESQEPISAAIFDPRSTTFDPPWLFGELDKPRIQQS